MRPLSFCFQDRSNEIFLSFPSLLCSSLLCLSLSGYFILSLGDVHSNCLLNSQEDDESQTHQNSGGRNGNSPTSRHGAKSEAQDSGLKSSRPGNETTVARLARHKLHVCVSNSSWLSIELHCDPSQRTLPVTCLQRVPVRRTHASATCHIKSKHRTT